MQRDAPEYGKSPPTEETAREHCLLSSTTTPDFVTAKDFIRFYVATSLLNLVDVPTVDSINTMAEWFFARFTCVTDSDTDEGERSKIYNVRWTKSTRC